MTPVLAAVCPVCSGGLRLRRRRSDDHEFVGCSGYPGCTFTSDLIPSLCAPEPAGVVREVDGALKALVSRWHPDRRREPLTPHEVVCELNAVRDHIKAATDLRSAAA